MKWNQNWISAWIINEQINNEICDHNHLYILHGRQFTAQRMEKDAEPKREKKVPQTTHASITLRSSPSITLFPLSLPIAPYKHTSNEQIQTPHAVFLRKPKAKPY